AGSRGCASMGSRGSVVGLPVYPAVMAGQQYQCTKGDPIPGEQGEVVLRNVAQQPTYADKCTDKGGAEASYPHAPVLTIQQRAFGVRFIGGGGTQGGDGEQKGMRGGCAAGQPEHQTADDACASAGGAWNQCERLSQADFQGVGEGDVVHFGDPDLPRMAFDPEHDQSAQDKGGGDRGGREQPVLDEIREQQAEAGQWQKGDQQLKDEPLCCAIPVQSAG